LYGSSVAFGFGANGFFVMSVLSRKVKKFKYIGIPYNTAFLWLWPVLKSNWNKLNIFSKLMMKNEN